MAVIMSSDREEWLAARRNLITATDIPAIMGVSPYRSEGDVAREKQGITVPGPQNVPMRVGITLEPLIAQIFSEETGVEVEPWGQLIVSPTYPWAGATPDYRTADGRILECKATQSRRWRDGLPEDVELQIRWQLGVTGYRRGVAAVLDNYRLRTFEVEHDEDRWEEMLDYASDFLRRLSEGGPFSESKESIARAHPADDGTIIEADASISEVVTQLIELQRQQDELEERIEDLKGQVKLAMGAASVLRGSGWEVRWKLTREMQLTDWRSLAQDVLARLPEEERRNFLQQYTKVAPGQRRFTVKETKREE